MTVFRLFVLGFLLVAVGLSLTAFISGGGRAQKCSSALDQEVIDLTGEPLKTRLAGARKWTAVGPVEVEFLRPGAKVAWQRFEVLDGNGLLIAVSHSCFGTCQGGMQGCGVQGCDPSPAGCTQVICTDGENCLYQCAKVSIQ